MSSKINFVLIQWNPCIVCESIIYRCYILNPIVIDEPAIIFYKCIICDTITTNKKNFR